MKALELGAETQSEVVVEHRPVAQFASGEEAVAGVLPLALSENLIAGVHMDERSAAKVLFVGFASKGTWSFAEWPDGKPMFEDPGQPSPWCILAKGKLQKALEVAALWLLARFGSHEPSTLGTFLEVSECFSAEDPVKAE